MAGGIERKLTFSLPKSGLETPFVPRKTFRSVTAVGHTSSSDSEALCIRRAVRGSGVLELGHERATTRPSATALPSAATHQAMLQQDCVICHNARLKTGGLAIDQLDVANVRRDAEAWEQVVRRLRVGAMPPRGARRPEAAASKALISWLEGELDKSGTSNPGRPTLHRLNRAEYANAIRDLLGLDVDVTSLPARRFGVRFRQRRGRAGQLAGAAAGLPRRGAQDQRRRGRRPAHRRRQRHLFRHGRTCRRTITSKGCRSARSAGCSATHTFPAGRRVRLPGAPLSHNLSAIRGLEDPRSSS